MATLKTIEADNNNGMLFSLGFILNDNQFKPVATYIKEQKEKNIDLFTILQDDEIFTKMMADLGYQCIIWC